MRSLKARKILLVLVILLPLNEQVLSHRKMSVFPLVILVFCVLIIQPNHSEDVEEDKLVEYVRRKGWTRFHLVDDHKLVSGKQIGKALSSRFRKSMVDAGWFSSKDQELLNTWDENIVFVSRRVSDLRPYFKYFVRLKPLAYAVVIFPRDPNNDILTEIRFVFSFFVTQTHLLKKHIVRIFVRGDNFF